jgi:hypothetical protein
MMIPFVQDWHFDPDYDQATKDWLAEGLDRPFTEWLKKSYLKIQSLFVTYPERKNAALAEAGDIAELACGAPVCCLMFLSCGRKSPIPTQCAIFVGGKAFISGHRNRCRCDRLAMLHCSFRTGSESVLWFFSRANVEP